MNYEQRNPVPLPRGAASQAVRTTMDSIFDWEYALRRQELLALYEKGKAASWNATDVDWTIDVMDEALRAVA